MLTFCLRRCLDFISPIVFRHSSVFIAVLMVLLSPLISCYSTLVYGQSEAASVTGRVTDESNLVMPEVEVEIKNVDTGMTYTTKTNGDGFYSFPSLPPGNYLMNIHRLQFRSVSVTGITLHVQDSISRNFVLQVGSSDVSVTVTADQNNINTTDATVSTVTDRQFVANLPLNGRTLQSLIELTPGVTLATVGTSAGQFSVNGQRAASNSFSVDGASANASVSTINTGGQQISGSLPTLSQLGTTNSLVSVDALQEFRVQTANYSAEYGRQPGGQIAFLTRSGTNGFHGTLFDFVRNDLFDARDYFNQTQLGERQSQERQNDFGGTLGGRIIRDKTFFFFSYEGFRLRVPFSTQEIVPSASARQAAPAQLQPYLNAFPQPNETDFGNGTALFNQSASSKSSLDSYSIRIDENLNSRLTLFGRYGRSPSSGSSPNGSTLFSNTIETQTATLGATWIASDRITNQVRFNYTRTEGTGGTTLANFGGAIPPPDASFFPSGVSEKNGRFTLAIFGASPVFLIFGRIADNLQRQHEFTDTVTWQTGSHLITFGGDYRRLSPVFGPSVYNAAAFFRNFSNFNQGNVLETTVSSGRGATILFNNLGTFVQDSWRALPRLTLNLGLRWDIDFTPSAGNGLHLLAVNGVDDLTTVAPAPLGTPIWHTRYNNFAPRFGLSYALNQVAGRETVLQAGFGIFYDLVSQETGGAISDLSFPFGVTNLQFCISPTLTGTPLCPAGPITFPFTPAEAQAPPFSATPPLPLSGINAFDPHLKMPYAYQYNLGVQQALGSNQLVTLRYVGTAGRQLLQQENISVGSGVNPNFSDGTFLRNGATSNYNSLQVQFERRMSSGLQARFNYTFAHSLDDASTSGSTIDGDLFLRSDPKANKGNSDFDIRHTLTTGLTYDLPTPSRNIMLRAILGGWSTDNIIQVRSGVPIDVRVNTGELNFQGLSGTGTSTVALRPDLTGQSVYIMLCSTNLPPPKPQTTSCPGGMALNPAAFALPPTDPSTGLPLRQGTLGRNFLRGFGAAQWDVSLRRQIKLRENLNLQLRSDFFNVLNHPDFLLNHTTFGTGFLADPQFGQATATLAHGLGGLTSLYQLGGPRSIQLSLKLLF